MTRWSASCRPKTAEGGDQPNHILADKTQKQSTAHLHHQVHVEVVSESHSAHEQTEPPPGFTHTDPDGLDKDDQLFIQFIGAQAEDLEQLRPSPRNSWKLQGVLHPSTLKT